MITQTLLQGERVILEPLKDINYLLDLADKDNKGLCSRKEIEDLFKNNECAFWLIILNETKRGVVGYFKIKDVYIMEALKDHEAKPTGIGYSLEVGELMLDYIFTLTNKVRTCALIKDKAIQLLCKRLGFIEIDRSDNLIIYEKER